MGLRIDYETHYHQLVLEQVRSSREYLEVFKNGRVAKHIMKQWMETYQLCHKHSSFKDSDRLVLPIKPINVKGHVWNMKTIKVTIKDWKK